MSLKTPKSAFLGTRVTKKTYETFRKRAARYGVPSDVLRELIEAFIENRLQIEAPPVTSKWKESPYVNRIQN